MDDRALSPVTIPPMIRGTEVPGGVVASASDNVVVIPTRRCARQAMNLDV